MKVINASIASEAKYGVAWRGRDTVTLKIWNVRVHVKKPYYALYCIAGGILRHARVLKDFEKK